MQHSRHFDSIDGTCTKCFTRPSVTDASKLARFKGKIGAVLQDVRVIREQVITLRREMGTAQLGN